MKDLTTILLSILLLIGSVDGQMNIDLGIQFNNKKISESCRSYTTNTSVTISLDPRNDDHTHRTVLAQYQTSQIHSNTINANIQGNWTYLAKTLRTKIESDCPFLKSKQFSVTIPQDKDLSGNVWEYPSYPSDINLSLKFSCVPGSFGATCNKFCQNITNSNLHCNQVGDLVCNDGYKFHDNDKRLCVPICKEVCMESGGKCIRPGVCLCRNNRYGGVCQNCNELCGNNNSIIKSEFKFTNGNIEQDNQSNKSCVFKEKKIQHGEIREFLCQLVRCNNSLIEVVSNTCSSHNCRYKKAQCFSNKECQPFIGYDDFCLMGNCSFKRQQYFCDLLDAEECTNCTSFSKWVETGLKDVSNSTSFYRVDLTNLLPTDSYKFSDLLRELYLLLQEEGAHDVFVNLKRILEDGNVIIEFNVSSKSLSNEEARNIVDRMLMFNKNKSLFMKRLSKAYQTTEVPKIIAERTNEANNNNELETGLFLLSCVVFFFIFGVTSSNFAKYYVPKIPPDEDRRTFLYTTTFLVEEDRQFIDKNSLIRGMSPPPSYREKINI